MRYMVVVERGETSWGAHVPDLPGCVAVGETREEVLRLIREAIEFHIEGLRHEGLPNRQLRPRWRRRAAHLEPLGVTRRSPCFRNVGVISDRQTEGEQQ